MFFHCHVFVLVISALWLLLCALRVESSSRGTHEVNPEIVCGSNAVISRQVREGPIPESPITFAVRDADENSTVESPGANLYGYHKLRIGPFSEDLNDVEKFCTQVGQSRFTLQGGTAVCTFDDILTEEKKEALLNEILPFAIEMHTSRLLVKPITGGLTVPESELMGLCKNFSIPASHKTEGVSGYDFLLYIAAAPTRDGSTAWATHCATTPQGRPSVGVASISPRYIYPGNTEFTGRVLAHEIGHALGFALDFFKAKGMTATATNIRGKPTDVLVLISPQVVKAGRLFFGWDELEYVELEDEGGAAVEGSHWKRRNLKDDLMAGVAGANKYSILTLAAFEDLGFYRANYSSAEYPVWGYQGGEKLLTQKCLVNDVSQVKSLFCSKSDEYLCTADRLAYGKCGVASYDVMLPSYARYFRDTYTAGSLPLMDYCPSVQGFANTGCRDGTLSLMPGSVVSPTSLCLEGNSDIEFNGYSLSTICAPVQCDAESQSYMVKVKGSSLYAACPEGTTIDLTELSSEFSSGTITCPLYSDMCHDAPNLTDLEKPMCLCKNLKKKATKMTSRTNTPTLTSSISARPVEPKENSVPSNSRRRLRKGKRYLVENGRIVRSLRKRSSGGP